MKLFLYLKLQGYFGYANDRTHVINVVVLVVKITIQLTYGIHGFKRRIIQQLAYSMAMPEPQESADNKYLGNRLLFKLAHQRSFNYQNCIKRITMKRMQVAGP
jgi:hypothetical protein